MSVFPLRRVLAITTTGHGRYAYRRAFVFPEPVAGRQRRTAAEETLEVDACISAG